MIPSTFSSLYATFVESTRTGNRKVYDNEYFRLKEISSTKEEFVFDINRCIYQEVFKKFGREDIGPIMCEYDSIIADNVSEWVRFEREETIASGCDKCTFRFYHIKKKFSDNPMIDSIYSFLKIIRKCIYTYKACVCIDSTLKLPGEES